MGAIRKLVFSLASAIVLFPCLARFSFGDIIEGREYHGKKIWCARSGFQSASPRCGADIGYASVFVGSVLSVTQLSKGEKQLHLMPEETFFGNPSRTVSVNTNQSECLGDIQVGDKWLFYLLRDENSKTLRLAYGSPSKPAADANNDIFRLRRLADMSDTGMLGGSVSKVVWDNNRVRRYDPVQNHKIVARREKDDVEYTAFTDSKGNYEFEPLPTGRYDFNADTTPGLWTEGGTVDISPRSCFEHVFQLEFDGRISGQVKNASGEPIGNAQVAAVPADDEEAGFKSDLTNKEGFFEIKGLHPGRYLIGIGIQYGHTAPEWKSRVYYPGVRTSDLAVVVEVSKEEPQANIKITLPQ